MSTIDEIELVSRAFEDSSYPVHPVDSPSPSLHFGR